MSRTLDQGVEISRSESTYFWDNIDDQSEMVFNADYSFSSFLLFDIVMNTVIYSLGEQVGTDNSVTTTGTSGTGTWSIEGSMLTSTAETISTLDPSIPVFSDVSSYEIVSLEDDELHLRLNINVSQEITAELTSINSQTLNIYLFRD